MATFNIIGNGFDLYHGLPTDYYYFGCYVLSHDECLYDDMADMYGFCKGIIHGHSEEVERVIADREYWSEFEKSLSFLSAQWVEGSLQDDLLLEYPDAVELEIEKIDRTNDIKNIMNQWIIDTIDRESNYELLINLLQTQKIKFNQDDAFLTFNYTHTLEKVYGVNNVLHIHGEASMEFDSSLILGHGDDEVIEKLEEKIATLELDDYDQPSKNREVEYKFEKQILKELRKPVGRCIANLYVFINNISEPNEIFLYGLSLGNVDLPYLKTIREKWHKCRWNFSYYGEADKKRIREVVEELKLPEKKWSIFYFNNPDYRMIREILIKRNGIIEYRRI